MSTAIDSIEIPAFELPHQNVHKVHSLLPWGINPMSSPKDFQGSRYTPFFQDCEAKA